VGARVAKAVGSSINTFAGSVDRSVRVGTVPSFLTAAGLWFVCYRVGFKFDSLVRDGSVVGHDVSPDAKDGYSKVATNEENADLESDRIGLTADEERNTDGDADDSTSDTNNVELTPLR
jgi:hypothetical protein